MVNPDADLVFQYMKLLERRQEDYMTALEASIELLERRVKALEEKNVGLEARIRVLDQKAGG